MNLKAFMIFAAVLGVAYGVGFLLIPNQLISFYGPTPTPSAIVGFRYFGVTLLAIGSIFWLARESHDAATVRALLTGHAIGDVAGIIVSIWGTASGIMNAFGWSAVLIYVILFAGCAYFLQLGARQVAATT
jgi:uncharacterized membrane protein YfcA